MPHGERRLNVNGVMCAPCEELLAELNPKQSEARLAR